MGNRSWSAPVAKNYDVLIEVGADLGDLGMRGPGVGTDGSDEVVDLAGRDAVPGTPRNHCERGLIHLAGAFQQRR